jgi:HK97 family phage prohead protease
MGRFIFNKKDGTMFYKQTNHLVLKHFDTSGRFSGYGSVFNNQDLHADVIKPGAFSRSLRDWNGKGQLPKMLWQHQTHNPIGMWERIREDDVGLYVEGQLFLDVQQGREAYTFLKNGVVDGLSIGFDIVKASPSAKGRTIHDIELYEISLVTFAANPLARVRDCKNDNRDHNLNWPMVAGYLHELKGLMAPQSY